MDPSKKVSQEYFDSVINENVNDFGMSEQEAIEDAINQFKSQGVDLSIICKYSSEEKSQLINSLRKLNELIPKLNENCDKEIRDSAVECLNIIKEKFNKDLSFRCLATAIKPEPNAYTVFVSYLENLKPPNHSEPGHENDLLIESFLNAFQSYLNQQSDILDSSGLRILIRLTSSEEGDNTGISGFGSHSSILNSLLKCLNTSCKLSESNRQFFVENGLCENLMKIFYKHKTNDLIIIEACQLIRSLLLDDDIRVEFSKSHEHAKYIASQLNGLDILLHIGLDNDSNLNEEALGSIMLTLSKLAVRNEYCQEICDKGGLKFVLKCVEEKHLKDVTLLKSALSLLKSICNNDQVKHEATKSNVIESLKQVLHKYNANSQVCELVCGALTSLLLRNPEASEQLFALQVHQLLVQLLNIHIGKPKLIKLCCLALRNSISRTRHLAEKLLELKIEDTLKQIMNEKDQQCYEEAKSVLRDLGCQVELKELWTGTGKNLSA